MSQCSNNKNRIWTPKELSKVPIGELKSIRVSVKRSNVASTGPATDLIRGIDDPKAISQLVHCKRGALRCAMFDRDDIVVNPEEQFVSVDTRLESSRSRNASRSASRSSRSPEYNRRNDRKDSRSKEKERKSSRGRSERTPVRDSVRRRSRSPTEEERWKRRSSSRDYRRRSRSKSKSASPERERFDRPSCSTRRSPSPRSSRKIGLPATSRSPVIRKRSPSPQRRMSRERSERRRSRSRSRTPRRLDAKYRDRREERRSRSPLYHSSRRRGSRSRSPPSGGGGGRRSSSRERRRMRSRSPRDRRRPRSRSRSPRRNGPRGAQHHHDPAATGHKMDPYAAAMASAMASYYEHMPPELWMNPAAAAAASAAAAAAMRFPGAGGPVPNRFFGMGARPFFPPGGGPPLYPRFPLPNYNTPYRPRQPRPVKPDGSATLPNAPPQATSTPLPESTTTGGSADGVREVSKQSSGEDDNLEKS